MFGLIGCCLFFWLFGSSPKPDPTQCDIPTSSSELIAAVDSMRTPTKTHKSSDVHETDFASIQPSPSDRAHEKIKREILVFVSKNCPPCERWKREQMQRFLDAGWSVGIVEAGQHSKPITPSYELSQDGKTVESVGYMTLEQAAEKLR